MGTLYVTCLLIAAIGTFTRAKMTKFDRNMDIFNEMKLMVIMYHMMCFSGLVPDPED